MLVEYVQRAGFRDIYHPDLDPREGESTGDYLARVGFTKKQGAATFADAPGSAPAATIFLASPGTTAAVHGLFAIMTIDWGDATNLVLARTPAALIALRFELFCCIPRKG